MEYCHYLPKPRSFFSSYHKLLGTLAHFHCKKCKKNMEFCHYLPNQGHVLVPIINCLVSEVIVHPFIFLSQCKQFYSRLPGNMEYCHYLPNQGHVLVPIINCFVSEVIVHPFIFLSSCKQFYSRLPRNMEYCHYLPKTQVIFQFQS